MLEESKEIWKEIDGLEGLYEVSTKGRVRKLKNGRILTGYCNKDGYQIVNLKNKPYPVHRLMALTFLPNPNNLPEVNHKNEVKNDNDISNLEWCTKSYNVNYSIHNQSCRINQLTLDGEFVKAWESSQQIERKLGYSQGHIIDCCKGKRKRAYGYCWEYSDPSQQRKVNRPVAVYKGNEHIGDFASAKKVSEELGLVYKCVGNCLKGRRATLHGYSFKYVD